MAKVTDTLPVVVCGDKVEAGQRRHLHYVVPPTADIARQVQRMQREGYQASQVVVGRCQRVDVSVNGPDTDWWLD